MTSFACDLCKADLGPRRLAGVCPKCRAQFAPAGAWRWLQHLPLAIVVAGIFVIGPVIQRFTGPFDFTYYTLYFVGIVVAAVIATIMVIRKAKLQWRPA